MEINWIAVAAAALAGFVIGAIWFGPKTFFPVWWKLLGKSPGENPGSESMVTVFGLTLAATLVQALAMNVVIWLAEASLGPVDWLGGLAIGSLMGFGFAAASSLGHKLFGGFGLKVWLLEVGQDIVSLAAMGAIIAAII